MRANAVFERALGWSSADEFNRWYDGERPWGLSSWEHDVRKALGRSIGRVYPEVPGWLPVLRLRDDGPNYERDDMWEDDR